MMSSKPAPPKLPVLYEVTDNPARKIGYTTLRGFFSMLKRQNKICKKMGFSVKFTIQLPVRD